MRFGRYDVSLLNFGFFRLDGGAMFGSVPKNIWSQRISCDGDNCIPLASRSLVLREKNRCILVDVGLGEKWGEKQRKIFAIENTPESGWGVRRDEVTDIVLTHLHFDHAGGISRYKEDGVTAELSFPKARIHIQGANVENAQNPSLKERASYLKENVDPVVHASPRLLHGTEEVLPDIWVHQVDGHSKGQEWIEVRNGKQSIVFPTDLIPTSRHLPIPFHMGYDACATTVLNEKTDFLAKAKANEWIVVFQHDPDISAATVTTDDRGHYAVKDKVDFS